jgi:hypothetical protein
MDEVTDRLTTPTDPSQATVPGSRPPSWLVRHWHAVKRRTGGVDREAVQWLFATCGVIASILGVVQFFWPDAPAAVGAWSVAGALVFGILGGLLLRLTRRTIRAVSSNGAWTIHVVTGNVLNFRPCVLTTDRRRSVASDRISPSSLIGQYLASLSPSRRTELESAIMGMRSGTLSRPGEVRVIEQPGQPGPVLLLACGRPTRNGTVTTWAHLSRTYDGLWAAVRAQHLDEISVPVIGAGYSKVSLSHSAVLLALLLSFHAASAERPVCRHLRIVVPSSDTDLEELVVSRRFLRALRYSLS